MRLPDFSALSVRNDTYEPQSTGVILDELYNDVPELMNLVMLHAAGMELDATFTTEKFRDLVNSVMKMSETSLEVRSSGVWEAIAGSLMLPNSEFLDVKQLCIQANNDQLPMYNFVMKYCRSTIMRTSILKIIDGSYDKYTLGHIEWILQYATDFRTGASDNLRNRARSATLHHLVGCMVA